MEQINFQSHPPELERIRNKERSSPARFPISTSTKRQDRDLDKEMSAAAKIPISSYSVRQARSLNIDMLPAADILTSGYSERQVRSISKALEEKETFPSIRHLMDGREFLHGSLSSPFRDYTSIYKEVAPTEPRKKESIQDIMKGRNFDIVYEEPKPSTPAKKESIQDIMRGRNFEIFDGKNAPSAGVKKESIQDIMRGRNFEIENSSARKDSTGREFESLRIRPEPNQGVIVKKLEYHQLLCQQQQRQLKRRNGRNPGSERSSPKRGAAIRKTTNPFNGGLYSAAEQSKLVW